MKEFKDYAEERKNIVDDALEKALNALDAHLTEIMEQEKFQLFETGRIYVQGDIIGDVVNQALEPTIAETCKNLKHEVLQEVLKQINCDLQDNGWEMKGERDGVYICPLKN